MTEPDELRRVNDDFRPLLWEKSRSEVERSLLDWTQSGLTVRVVRGRKMRTISGLLGEFASALQFPEYFGGNKDAFDECISELEDLSPGVGYVILVTEPDQVLLEDAEEMSWLLRSLTFAAKEWARPIDRGEWWDRPPVPFHVVLVGDRGAIERAARHWGINGPDLQR